MVAVLRPGVAALHAAKCLPRECKANSQMVTNGSLGSLHLVPEHDLRRQWNGYFLAARTQHTCALCIEPATRVRELNGLVRMRNAKPFFQGKLRDHRLRAKGSSRDNASDQSR